MQFSLYYVVQQHNKRSGRAKTREKLHIGLNSGGYLSKQTIKQPFETTYNIYVDFFSFIFKSILNNILNREYIALHPKKQSDIDQIQMNGLQKLKSSNYRLSQEVFGTKLAILTESLGHGFLSFHGAMRRLRLLLSPLTPSWHPR